MDSGIYEVISDVKIRREPDIVEVFKDGKLITNQVGFLKVGTHREVYSVLTKKDNTTWGRISESDAAGIAEWACIKGLNRTYMKFIKPLENPPVSDLDNIKLRLGALELRVGQLESRLTSLENIVKG